MPVWLLLAPHGFAGSALPRSHDVVSTADVPRSREIAPGVTMPFVNLGGVHSHPGNFSAWLSLGGTGLDTAMLYGDDIQVQVGDAIKGSGQRGDLFVTTKVPCCPTGGIGAAWCDWYVKEFADLDAYTRGSIDLRLLGIEYADLMLMHWPCSDEADTIKTYRALEAFQLAGKARAIGISNFNSSAIDALYAAPGGLRVLPAVNQNGFSIAGHNSTLNGRDMATLAKCNEKNITFSAYSPLGGLTGVDVLGNPTVIAVGKAHNKSSAQVALRWVTQQGVVAVTSATNPEYLAEDLDIFDFTLSDAEMATLAAI